MKEGLGGNLRLILSGAAPLSSTVETYLRIVTCANVLQGYGTRYYLSEISTYKRIFLMYASNNSLGTSIKFLFKHNKHE